MVAGQIKGPLFASSITLLHTRFYNCIIAIVAWKLATDYMVMSVRTTKGDTHGIFTLENWLFYLRKRIGYASFTIH